MINKYYMAYGSNLNIKQMSRICPYAKIVGTGILENYRLVFKRYATIEPDEGAYVPVAVWEIDDRCETRLDRFESFPELYHKEMFDVRMDEEEYITAMAYVINSDVYEIPSHSYLETILYGYADMELELKCLVDAVSYTEGLINN